MTKIRSTLALFAAVAGACLLVASSRAPASATMTQAPMPGWTVFGRTTPVPLPPVPFHGCVGTAVAKDHQDKVYGVVFCDNGVVVLLPTYKKAS